MPANTNAKTGMFEPGAFFGTHPKNKAAGITINAGDICNRDTGTDPDSFRTCPTSGTGPFVFAEKTSLAAAGETRFSAIDYPCEVNVKCDGAIPVGSKVQTSATTAGRVMASAGTLATNNRFCGVYQGKPGEGDATQPLRDAADGEVIKIWFEPNAGSPGA